MEPRNRTALKQTDKTARWGLNLVRSVVGGIGRPPLSFALQRPFAVHDTDDGSNPGSCHRDTETCAVDDVVSGAREDQAALNGKQRHASEAEQKAEIAEHRCKEGAGAVAVIQPSSESGSTAAVDGREIFPEEVRRWSPGLPFADRTKAEGKRHSEDGQEKK